MKFKAVVTAIFTLALSLQCFADAHNVVESNNFFKHYDMLIPPNWEIQQYPHQGEITFLSPKHSCIIHINYDAKSIVPKKNRYEMALSYQKALASDLGQTPKDQHGLKIATPKSFDLNNFEGFSFDYVNFFEDGRYLSGQSFILFDKVRGTLTVDLNSSNYKTRKACLGDAKKYLKTLKSRSQ